MNEAVDDPSLESLLEYLRDTRSLDFTGYKRPSLTRRILKRAHAVGAASFEEYRDVLEADPDEQARLVDTILINVTSFFRDGRAWEFLAAEVVPDVVAAAGPDGPIRVWSAGCATGEEAYSLAMVFADHLGIDAFRARVKIFATDIDEAALAEARRGTYSPRRFGPVSAERRERYFEEQADGLVFRADCRRQVIFGRNDVTADAPISRLDLLVCRNVLMYLLADTQRVVLERFSYALRPTGYLLLGKAETITTHADLFEPVSRTLRVFRRSQVEAPRLGLTGLGEQATTDVLHDLALAASPVAQVVLDVDGRLSGANIKARSMLGIRVADIGRSFWDLEISRRPVDLRALVEQAYAEAHPVVLHEVTRLLADGTPQFLEVSIAPLATSAGIDLGASVTFADVTELGNMRLDLERSSRDVAVANAGLRSINEQLETSNEELQSTNEELETTNEELQSANEELETTNEELQSANEELETMNEELLTQTHQVEATYRFLTAVLDGLPITMVVLDRDFTVIVWNSAADDMFGLHADEVIGRSFLALDIGIPVEEIGPLLRQAGSSGEPRSDEGTITLDAVDRRGRAFPCRVSVGPIAGGPDGEATLLVTMERTDSVCPEPNDTR